MFTDSDSDVPVAKSSKREEERRRSASTEDDRPAGDGSSLSIHETNKLRAKLGLKPLQVESSPSPAPTPKKAAKGKEVEEGEAEPEFDEETLQRIQAEREAEGETFWKEKQEFVHAPAENLTEKLKTDKIKQKLSTLREKRKLESKLVEVKGLADSDSDDDASAWVQKQKTLADQKALAEKRVSL